MLSEHVGVTRWLELIQAEYREMPDLSLNKSQMQRWWGFDAFVCDALVEALVRAGVLRKTANGNFMAQRTNAWPHTGGNGGPRIPLRRRGAST